MVVVDENIYVYFSSEIIVVRVEKAGSSENL